jgi:hypothetical protein
MTPKTAIKKECKYCKNNLQFECYSEACQLNNHELVPLKRIKAYCITCVPEQSLQGVRKCNGKILNPIPHICPLWSYRFGKNPKRKGRTKEWMDKIRDERYLFKSTASIKQKNAQI